jgi:hypothetical protein
MPIPHNTDFAAPYVNFDNIGPQQKLYSQHCVTIKVVMFSVISSLCFNLWLLVIVNSLQHVMKHGVFDL